MNPTIASICQQAPIEIQGLLTEAADELTAALLKCVEEAKLQDADAVLSVGFTIKANVDTGTVDYQLAWSVRHKLSTSRELEDPNQPELPELGRSVAEFGEFCKETGTTVTMSSGETSVTIGPEHAEGLRRAAKGLRGRKKTQADREDAQNA